MGTDDRPQLRLPMGLDDAGDDLADLAQTRLDEEAGVVVVGQTCAWSPLSGALSAYVAQLRTRGPDGFEYEWTMTRGRLAGRRFGARRWTLAAKNVTTIDHVDEYVFGYCQHTR